jgi:hypothetical protein
MTDLKPIAQSRQDNVLPIPNTPCQIIEELSYTPEQCRAFLVKQKYIDARRAGVKGTYIGWVPGAGGDVWWVRHEDDSVGAYMFTEILDV